MPLPHESPPPDLAPDQMAIAQEVIVSAGNILSAAGFSRAEIAAFLRQAADQLDPAAAPHETAMHAPAPADPHDALVAGLAAIEPMRAIARLMAQGEASADLRDHFDLAMRLIPQIAEAQGWLRGAAREAGLALAASGSEPGSLALDAFHAACAPAFARIAAVAETLAADGDEAALRLILMSLVDNDIAISRDLKEAMERAVARLGSES